MVQVVSVYMFHELPEDVRDLAAKEMYRVLKPNGLAVFCDSVQLGDRPEWNHSMANFSEWGCLNGSERRQDLTRCSLATEPGCTMHI
eukprot:scaffold4236_cov21-Tisochrysis_lutea.AAC.1